MHIFVVNTYISWVCLGFMLFLIVYSLIKLRDKGYFNFIMLQVVNLGYVVGGLLFYSASFWKIGDTGVVARIGFTLMLICFELYAPVYLSYMRKYLEINKRASSFLMFFIKSLVLISIALLIYNAVTENLFSIAVDNPNGVRGVRFWPMLVIPMISFATIAYELIRGRRKMRYTTVIDISFFSILPITGIVTQVASGGYALLEISASLGILAIFYNIEYVVLTEYEKKQKNLVESKVALMMTTLSINTVESRLNTVSELCDTNPAEAKKAVRGFAKDLRTTIDAVNENLKRQGTDDGKI